VINTRHDNRMMSKFKQLNSFH